MSEDIKKDECCGSEDCGCDSNHTNDEGCGCGHDHNHDEGHDFITLTLENDEDVECAVLGVFDVEDQEYIALLPPETDDVFIYIYNEDENGEVSLENIEKQEDFDKVSAVFLELIEDEDDSDEA